MPLVFVVPLVVLMVLLLPVLLPVALFLGKLEDRRCRATADRSFCLGCGTLLGEAAVTRADAAWAQHCAHLRASYPTIRFRLVRKVRAICGVCAARHAYDDDTGRFTLLSPDLH